MTIEAVPVVWCERDEVGFAIDERMGFPVLFARGWDGVDVRIVCSVELVEQLARQAVLAAALSREHGCSTTYVQRGATKADDKGGG